MGHIARILAALAILAAGSLPLAAFDGPTQTTGSKKKAGATSKPADEPAEKEGGENDKQKVAVLAQRALEAGIKLYESGKTDEAVKTLDVALHGGLSSQQVARAFYYRGLANRKLGKPGLAISDLTSAVWLKDGLAGPEREAALKNRIAAYQDAGISNVPDLPTPTFAADPPSTSGWQTAMNGSPRRSSSGGAEHSGTRGLDIQFEPRPCAGLRAGRDLYDERASGLLDIVGWHRRLLQQHLRRRLVEHAQRQRRNRVDLLDHAAPAAAGSGSSTADDRLGPDDPGGDRCARTRHRVRVRDAGVDLREGVACGEDDRFARAVGKIPAAGSRRALTQRGGRACSQAHG